MVNEEVVLSHSGSATGETKDFTTELENKGVTEGIWLVVGAWSHHDGYFQSNGYYIEVNGASDNPLSTRPKRIDMQMSHDTGDGSKIVNEYLSPSAEDWNLKLSEDNAGGSAYYEMIKLRRVA